jgi:hypothetical protein
VALSARSYAVSFGQDLSLFIAWAVIPVWAAREMHATETQLGFLPVIGGVAYVVTSVAGGSLSDRVSRTTLARIGLVLFSAFCFLAWRAHSIAWIYAVTALGGIGNALVWPGLQALVADESEPADLERNLGAFSLSWSVGKSLGFLVAGFLYREFGLHALAGCAALSLVLAPIVPSRSARHRASAASLLHADGPPASVRNAFLRAAWLANFGAYGLGATLNFLYPKLVVSAGRPPEHFNYVLFTLFASQTAAFGLFGRRSGWRFRAAPLYACQVVGAAGLLVIGLGAPLAAALPAAVAAGLGLGLAYTASIFYSVHSDEARGARAGIHEAVIGASNFVVPLLAGTVEQNARFGGAGYLLVAGMVVAGIAGQVRILRKG